MSNDQTEKRTAVAPSSSASVRLSQEGGFASKCRDKFCCDGVRLLSIRELPEEGTVLLKLEVRRDGAVGKKQMKLLIETMVELSLHTGELSDELFEMLCEREVFDRAVLIGLTLLSYGDNTQKTLERKMIQRGIPRNVATEAVNKLSECGYIPEDDIALRYAAARADAGWGRNMVISYLREKGIDVSSCEAVKRYLDDFDFTESGVKALILRYGKRIPAGRGENGDASEKSAFLQKAAGYLFRRGFSRDEIREAIRLWIKRATP